MGTNAPEQERQDKHRSLSSVLCRPVLSIAAKCIYALLICSKNNASISAHSVKMSQAQGMVVGDAPVARGFVNSRGRAIWMMRQKATDASD
jgi:hypothetical protein